MDEPPTPDNSPVSMPQTSASPSPKKLLQPTYFALTLIAGILMGVGGLFAYQEYSSQRAVSSVTTYDECVTAPGSRIQESYPATCITKNGNRFTQPTIDDGTNPIYTDPLSCMKDSDCVVGIQSNGCCACPEPINKSQIGRDGWESYIQGKDYGDKSTCQTFTACKPCETPSALRCRNNQCTFENDITVTPPASQYTCPTSEWIDCMPGPLEGNQNGVTTGIKFECTDEFLTWAKSNCPNFKGAAY